MSTQESKAGALQRRLVSSSADVIRIGSSLPNTPQAKHISQQIVRAGTSVAANYGEARAAESRSDFIHKLRIVLKELNETLIWFQLIDASSFLPRDKTERIIAENDELCRIIAASIKTAGGFNRSKES